MSQLPWSAVTINIPLFSSIFSIRDFTHLSTVSTAVIAAFKSPVWPTISGLAKLTMITSTAWFFIAFIALFNKNLALISGCKS